jgi:hypothetical protein
MRHRRRGVRLDRGCGAPGFGHREQCRPGFPALQSSAYLRAPDPAEAQVAPRSHGDAKRANSSLRPRLANPRRCAQTRMSRPPPHVHGKEGVDGSSPSEGFENLLQIRTFGRSSVAATGDGGRTWPRFSGRTLVSGERNPCRCGSCTSLSMPTRLAGKEGVAPPDSGQTGHLRTQRRYK